MKVHAQQAYENKRYPKLPISPLKEKDSGDKDEDFSSVSVKKTIIIEPVKRHVPGSNLRKTMQAMHATTWHRPRKSLDQPGFPVIEKNDGTLERDQYTSTSPSQLKDINQLFLNKVKVKGDTYKGHPLYQSHKLAPGQTLNYAIPVAEKKQHIDYQEKVKARLKTFKHKMVPPSNKKKGDSEDIF